MKKETRQFILGLIFLIIGATSFVFAIMKMNEFDIKFSFGIICSIALVYTGIGKMDK